VASILVPVLVLGAQGEPVLYAFDLLCLDGQDLRQTALLERKRRLAELIKSAGCKRILYAQHIEQHGKRFFEQICARNLEGIVAKRKLGIYKDDGTGWLEIKNPAYSQAEGRHELLTRRAWKAQNSLSRTDPLLGGTETCRSDGCHFAQTVLSL
jgi:ATP-dependent DNA ligase